MYYIEQIENKIRVGEVCMDKIREIIAVRSEDIVKVLTVVILFLTLVIIIFVYKGNSRKEDFLENQTIEEILVEQNSETNSVEQIEPAIAEQIVQKIIVDVKGAVDVPGVYEMQADSRVIDCIEKAGGFLIEAEQKSVNLAQRAEDQMVIYIPMKGEDISEIEQLLPDVFTEESTNDIRKVNLNKATKEELKLLNGIGDMKAESIISYREINGPFQKVEDIKNVSGIGEATFDKLRDAIQVTP